MTNENGNQNEIRDAFKNLGQNIRKAVDSAWDSEQRAHVQEQIEYGQRSKFNISSRDQAQQIIAALTKWTNE